MSDPLAPLRKAPGLVRIHGHRGARGVLPENTLIGFRHCFDTGIEIVEIDVLMTADNIPVLTHNPRLMAAATRLDGRWLEGEGPAIRGLSLAALQAHDVGGLRPDTAYGSRYPDQAFLSGVCVPTLADLAALVCTAPYADCWLNIEIKSSPAHPEHTPPIADYVAGVMAVLTRFALENRVIVQSFDWRILKELKRVAPEIPRSHLSYLDRETPPMDPNILDGSEWMAGASRSDAGGSLPDLIADLGGAVWSPYHTDITAKEVARAQERGLIVNAWTVNTPEEINAAIDAGVDGLITDYPARAQRLLLARGLSWRDDIHA